MIAKELIPKLQMAKTTGNSELLVVVRLLKSDDPKAAAETLLQPMYGKSGVYEVIKLAPSNPYEFDVEVTFNLDAAIKHLQSKVVNGDRDVLSGGIIYPTFDPEDVIVSYPDLNNAYNSSTALFEPKLDPNLKIET